MFRRMVTAVFAAAVAVMMASSSPALAGSNVEVVKANQKFEGKTPGGWSADWWQWAASLPASVHPISDPTKFCDSGQHGPVWFLATPGSNDPNSDPIHPTCTLPNDVAVMVPILNAECSANEVGFPCPDLGIKQAAKFIADHIVRSSITLSIDGNPVKPYRVQSPGFFTETWVADNLFTAGVGPAKAFADGYYVLLKPLKVGQHHVVWKATADFTDVGQGTFTENVDYTLNVVAPAS